MRDNDLFQLALGITSPWFVASSAFDAAKRRSRIVSEHRRRQGDPAAGGSTRQPVMTAYRQQALACAAVLSKAPARPRDLKIDCPDAAKILQNNVYGWFVRIERGFYALTAAGRAALVRCNPDLPARSAARSESVLAAE